MTTPRPTCCTCAFWRPWNKHPNCRRGTCQVLFTFRLGNIGVARFHEEVRVSDRERATTHRDFGCNQHYPQLERSLTCRPQ